MIDTPIDNYAELRTEAKSERLGRLRDLMRDNDFEIAVIYGSGQNSLIGRPNPCWYFSGVKQLGPDACLVVPAEDDPVLITTPLWDEERVRDQGWVEEVIAVDSLAGAIGTEMRSRHWSGRRVGLMGAARASREVYEAINLAVGEHCRDFEVFEQLAQPHDELSLALLARSVAVAEAGYARLNEVAEAGMTEFELAAECELTIRSLGAEDNFQLIAASQQHLTIRAPQDRQICEGDVLLAEISPCIEGQFAQICRSSVLGEATSEQNKAHAILREAFSAGIDECKPGQYLSRVATAMNDVIASHGFGEYNKPPYMRVRGHGLGLGSSHPATITADSKDILEVGMSFVLHPNQYFPEAGYLLCGDQVAITPDGARVFANLPSEFNKIGGK